MNAACACTRTCKAFGIFGFQTCIGAKALLKLCHFLKTSHSQYTNSALCLHRELVFKCQIVRTSSLNVVCREKREYWDSLRHAPKLTYGGATLLIISPDCLSHFYPYPQVHDVLPQLHQQPRTPAHLLGTSTPCVQSRYFLLFLANSCLTF